MCKAGVRCGGESCPDCHHIINQKNIPILDHLATSRMRREGVSDIGKAPGTPPAILRASVTRPDQQVRTMIKIQMPRQRATEQGGLVIAPLGKAQPMQWHRCDKHLRLQHRPCHTRHPTGCRQRVIFPIMVFQPKQNLTRPSAIEHCRATLRPRPRQCHAVITMKRSASVLSRQRHTTTVAASPKNEWRLFPARRAECTFFLNQRIAGHTLRRVDSAQQFLRQPKPQMGCSLAQLLHSAPVPPRYDSNMTQPPPDLTDRKALIRNRARAAGDMFLHEIAREELQLRLTEVNRVFTKPAIVTGHFDYWAEFLPDARVIEDTPVLALKEGAHDLVLHVMALHWASDPVGQLVQARRALCPDGLFLAVLLGGQTLSELRACLAQAEVELSGGLSPRVLPMAELRDLGGLLQRAGFALPVADSVCEKVRYQKIERLFSDLRQMGEQNALAARRRRFAPRALFERTAEIYTAHHADSEGRLKASFDLVFLTGWAPDSSQPRPLRPGSATTRLADALNAKEMPLPDQVKIPGKD